MDSYSLQYEEEMWDAIASSDRDSSDTALLGSREVAELHDIVRTTPLRAYPGWEIREYTNGAFVAWQRFPGVAVSGACSSFREAVAWIRTQA